MAGGWRDLRSLEKCYQQVDAQTLLDVGGRAAEGTRGRSRVLTDPKPQQHDGEMHQAPHRNAMQGLIVRIGTAGFAPPLVASRRRSDDGKKPAGTTKPPAV